MSYEDDYTVKKVFKDRATAKAWLDRYDKGNKYKLRFADGEWKVLDPKIRKVYKKIDNPRNRSKRAKYY